ncbi:three-prime repair exonuclease 1-like [Cydia pomonella]|uniref:three-prime repair exonuclease 1-like n=1 Tax=Cydia pomonella TaxID=82600 RepID=UPI002ADD3CA0|nr:three-prime repair exonuclease 1-like [Cydia pomonella]
MAPIATYVFLDFGTTGKNPKVDEITELCMVAVKRQHLLDTPRSRTTPRVQHKLLLCFKVDKQITYVARSDGKGGFTNEDLEHESYFDMTGFQIIDNFLKRLTKPVCLVAHFGRIFDYPLLKRHLTSLNVKFSNKDLWCADTHLAFFDILQPEPAARAVEVADDAGPSADDAGPSANDAEPSADAGSLSAKNTLDMRTLNETTPRKRQRIEQPNINRVPAINRPFPWGGRENLPTERYGLEDVYRRVFNREPEDAHKAEADCILMLEIAVELGQRFVDWIDNEINLLRFPDDINPV